MMMSPMVIFEAIEALLKLLIMALSIKYFFRIKLKYWEEKGLIVVLQPTVPFGNIARFVTSRITLGQEFVDIYTAAKLQGLKHTGIYQLCSAVYVPIDPELIERILVKDFNYFVNREMCGSAKYDPLNYNLFTSEGSKWRNMRAKLTPAFTSGKIKMMFTIMAECAKALEDLVDELTEKKEAANIKGLLGRFSADIIGSCAFGLHDTDSEFRKYGKKLFGTNLISSFNIMMSEVLPPSPKFLKRVKIMNDTEKYFMNTFGETVRYRETRQVYRKDFVHLLLQLKNLGKVTDDDKFIDDKDFNTDETLTTVELAAQAFMFFKADFETSSATMIWTLYELCRNCDVQNKLRDEIKAVMEKHDGNLSYDAVLEMTYLDKIIKETLRMYPAVPVISRKCNKTYPVPGTSFVLASGTQVRIPVLGLHTDPEYYPEPDKFDPERFSEEEKNKRPPCTYLPFGEGPRHCIGMRFGLMQTKIGVITVVKNYKIRLNKKTKTPMEYDARSVVPAARGGIWLDFEKV